MIGLMGGLLMCLCSISLHGQPFVVNGSAVNQGGDCYQLTPDVPSQAGTIFSQNPIDLTQAFYEEATLFFGCKDGNGADGIVFILATTNTPVGAGGGGIGYEGISPSIAIEYDDYFNSIYNDPTSDHMAIISMGQLDHSAATNLAGPINLSNIENCMVHCFAVGWDPVTHTLAASLDGEEISYSGDIVASIFGGNPLVYYGFSAGTGGLSNIHRVCFGPPALVPMPDVSVCEGESVILEADPNGVAWTWEPDPTLSQYDIEDPEATPDITTTYSTVIEYLCGFIHYDTVVVTVIPLPEPEADNNGPVCVGETILLTADGGVSYEWDGPMGFTSTVQNPVINNIDIGMDGLYTVTVTDGAGCSAIATTLVEIDLGPEIEFDPLPDPLCENYGPFQLTAIPSGGLWDGDITPNGIFDPGYTGVGIQTVTYTVSNAIGCINSASLDIEVLSIPDVLINPPGILCENGAPVQMTGSPSGGNWTGDITLNGLFDPVDAGPGFHLITYEANDGNGCTNAEQIVIEVTPVMPADIASTGPFCGTDTIILTANPPGGTWGGAADTNGLIRPFALSEGLHLVTYQVNTNNGCYYTEANIEIQYETAVQCFDGPQLCTNAPPVTLVAEPPGGTWITVASPSGVVDPSTLSPGLYMAIYEGSSNICGVNSCWTYVEIFDAPSINTISFDCDSLSAFYTVSFAITGGDTSSYLVSGTTNGVILSGFPYRFVSDPIPSGGAYTFVVDDIHQCNPDTVTGSFICNCATNAGTMDVNPITACESDAISLMPPTGVSLDPDDSLVYVLHLGFPDSILLVSDSLSFTLVPALQTGVAYYVSSVAGNASGGIGVDLSDPCLSVSFGTPVMWAAEPSGGIGGSTAVCAGDSATLTFFLTGTGPFDVTYSDGSNTYTSNGISPGHTIKVLPSATTTYTLTGIAETIPPFCNGHPGTTHSVEVFQNYLIPGSSQICFGDSLLIGGEYQKVGGIYHDSLLTTHGCDSVLVTTLTVYSLDTTYLSDKTCDPSQTGIFTTAMTDQHGCDSTIITTVTFTLVDTTLIQSNTCDQQAAGVFSYLLSGQDGCDSLVIETITYLPPDSTWISGTTCVPADAGTFIEVQMNAAGCDSFIIETILLIPSDTTVLAGETCDPTSAGVFMQTLVNAGGCDSLVIETIALLPTDTTMRHQFTCFPQDTGRVEQIYTNSFGCDSIVVLITSLSAEDSCTIVEIHKDVFVPNVFSPNNDGINDYFLVFANPEAVINIPSFTIYDRWGGLILDRKDILPNDEQFGWDGTWNSVLLNPGVYVWRIAINFTDGTKVVLFGNVTLIR